jgi:hypothetical protein
VVCLRIILCHYGHVFTKGKKEEPRGHLESWRIRPPLPQARPVGVKVHLWRIMHMEIPKSTCSAKPQRPDRPCPLKQWVQHLLDLPGWIAIHLHQVLLWEAINWQAFSSEAVSPHLALLSGRHSSTSSPILQSCTTPPKRFYSLQSGQINRL